MNVSFVNEDRLKAAFLSGAMVVATDHSFDFCELIHNEWTTTRRERKDTFSLNNIKLCAWVFRPGRSDALCKLKSCSVFLSFHLNHLIKETQRFI